MCPFRGSQVVREGGERDEMGMDMENPFYSIRFRVAIAEDFCSERR